MSHNKESVIALNPVAGFQTDALTASFDWLMFNEHWFDWLIGWKKQFGVSLNFELDRDDYVVNFPFFQQNQGIN